MKMREDNDIKIDDDHLSGASTESGTEPSPAVQLNGQSVQEDLDGALEAAAQSDREAEKELGGLTKEELLELLKSLESSQEVTGAFTPEVLLVLLESGFTQEVLLGLALCNPQLGSNLF